MGDDRLLSWRLAAAIQRALTLAANGYARSIADLGPGVVEGAGSSLVSSRGHVIHFHGLGQRLLINPPNLNICTIYSETVDEHGHQLLQVVSEKHAYCKLRGERNLKNTQPKLKRETRTCSGRFRSVLLPGTWTPWM